MTGRFYNGVLGALLLASSGCAEYTSQPTSFILPTSNKAIDTVLHRSDVRFLDCSTLTVIQTYDTGGKLVDAQAARGQALHCGVFQAVIEAGGRVGAAAVVRPAITRINNAVSNAVSNTNQQGQQQQQGQTQGQQQGQQQGQGQEQNAYGGQGGQGGHGGEGGHGGQGGHGNNGGGNGDGDGSNPGTGHHHGNGDNN